MKKIFIFLSLLAPFVLGYIIFKTQTIERTKINLLTVQKKISAKLFYSPQIPDLDKVFQENHKWIATLSADRVRVIIATGDVIPARSVNYQAIQRKYFKWAFEKVSDKTKDADITFINLEAPLLENCPVTQEGMIFCGNKNHIEGLVYSGVDLASLANNHVANHGISGVEETISLLQSNNIDVTGINGPFIKNVRGVKFAFLGYNDISNPQRGISNFEEEKLVREIADAKKIADVIIVTFQWGAEYRSQPDLRQKQLAYLTIDAGADLIIGNHPHWIQPIEMYKGKLITYAHGNFVFDQMWSEETKKGVIGRYTFYDNQLIDIEFLPLYIKDYGQPYFLEGTEKITILSEMKKESLILLNQK